jgi:predicted O-methyltransferase YrrM
VSIEVLDRYRALGDLPPLVSAAVEASLAAGVDQACIPEVGRLLMVLAAHHPGARLGELGTACGVGAAWLASGMNGGATLVTTELDPGRASVAARVLSERPEVRAMQGDWRLMADHGPFDLLFVDGGLVKSETSEVLALLAPGGMALFDDLTPFEAWSADMKARYPDGDPLRLAWRSTPAAVCTEIRTTPTESALLIVKTG